MHVVKVLLQRRAHGGELNSVAGEMAERASSEPEERVREKSASVLCFVRVKIPLRIMLRKYKSNAARSCSLATRSSTKWKSHGATR